MEPDDGGVDLAMMPTVLLVVLLQKHLVRGLLVTGLGGR